MSLSNQHRLIVVIDGECVVCSGFSAFIAQFSPDARLMWAQHAVTKQFLGDFNISFDDVMRSIVAVHEGKVYRGSDAFIQVLSTMPWYFAALSWFIWLFPTFIREYVYGLVSSNRYTLFGKKESCTLPSASMKAKFLHPV
jgi:predicted DCC family thiol-disulfide oxidoreductase YuxK